jgi:hypothetical protein
MAMAPGPDGLWRAWLPGRGGPGWARKCGLEWVEMQNSPGSLS